MDGDCLGVYRNQSAKILVILLLYWNPITLSLNSFERWYHYFLNPSTFGWVISLFVIFLKYLQSGLRNTENLLWLWFEPQRTLDCWSNALPKLIWSRFPDSLWSFRLFSRFSVVNQLSSWFLPFPQRSAISPFHMSTYSIVKSENMKQCIHCVLIMIIIRFSATCLASI
jgi:hypothetical protein